MNYPPFFYGGRVPENMCEFLKKNVVTSFRIPKKKNFFLKTKLSKFKNSFKNGLPNLIYEGRVPKKHVWFSPKKNRPAAKKNF